MVRVRVSKHNHLPVISRFSLIAHARLVSSLWCLAPVALNGLPSGVQWLFLCELRQCDTSGKAEAPCGSILRASAARTSSLLQCGPVKTGSFQAILFYWNTWIVNCDLRASAFLNPFVCIFKSYIPFIIESNKDNLEYIQLSQLVKQESKMFLQL